MSANIPQTKEQALASKEKLRFRLLLLIIMITTTLVVAMLNWMGLIKPGAAASMSNGGFCIVASGYDDEFAGKAGAKDCGSKPVPVVPATLRVQTCSAFSTMLGFDRVELAWESNKPLAAQSLSINGTRLTTTITAAEGDSLTRYTARVSKADVSAAVGALAGNSLPVRITSADKAATATAAWQPLGGNTTCTITT